MNLRHVTKFPLSFNLLYLIRKKTFMLGLYVWEVLAQGSSWAARKPQTANRKISRDRVLAVTFARVALGTRKVCSLQFTASSRKWIRQGFLPLKIVQPRVYRYELAFHIRLRCVCWIFDLESMNYCCFLGDEGWWKQHGGPKEWTNQFYIPFCRTNKRKYSIPIQS